MTFRPDPGRQQVLSRPGYVFTTQGVSQWLRRPLDANTARATQIDASSGEYNDPRCGVYRRASRRPALVDTNANGLADDGATHCPRRSPDRRRRRSINGVGDTTATTTTGVDGYDFWAAGRSTRCSSPPPPALTTQDVGANGFDDPRCQPHRQGPDRHALLRRVQPDPDAGVYQYAHLGDRLWVDTTPMVCRMTGDGHCRH